MTTRIALLRGINVGGKTSLPMKELVEIIEDIGARNVETYIQSGNVVFQSEEPDASVLSERIKAGISSRCGFEPQVLVLDIGRLRRAVEGNPFPEAESEPKSLHVYFLTSRPDAPDFDGLEDLSKDSEQFALGDGVFYLYAPDGFGRSKLAAKVEKLLGVAATARNWRTVRKILELAERRD